ncbi:MAG: hypothetical protein HGA76_08810, partial [Candidatus Firestonebacteria bacterium]|nr:hypothetical protein [Candidatus Firestonebacteria bacterium]
MTSSEVFKRPLIPLALAAEAGCLAGAYRLGNGFFWLSCAVLGAMIFWWARRCAWAWLGILLTALGAYALWSSQAGRLPEDSLIRYLPQADVRL